MANLNTNTSDRGVDACLGKNRRILNDDGTTLQANRSMIADLLLPFRDACIDNTGSAW